MLLGSTHPPGVVSRHCYFRTDFEVRVLYFSSPFPSLPFLFFFSPAGLRVYRERKWLDTCGDLIDAASAAILMGDHRFLILLLALFLCTLISVSLWNPEVKPLRVLVCSYPVPTTYSRLEREILIGEKHEER